MRLWKAQGTEFKSTSAPGLEMTGYCKIALVAAAMAAMAASGGASLTDEQKEVLMSPQPVDTSNGTVYTNYMDVAQLEALPPSELNALSDEKEQQEKENGTFPDALAPDVIRSVGRRLLDDKIFQKKGGGLAHTAAQVATGVGAAIDVAGAATEAYGLSTGDKNAQALGAGELGVGTATGIGGGIGAAATHCHYDIDGVRVAGSALLTDC